MSYEWQRSKDMPDFTRTGQQGASSGRLGWLVLVLALLGGAVLVSFIGSATTPLEPAAESTGTTGTPAQDG
ncbi:MAG: hypothetical protein RIG84_07665 [Roseovarius sp.]